MIDSVGWPLSVLGMRRARLKVPADWGVGVYHCISRVVEGRFAFDPGDKQQFVSLMREYEAFCGVEVLTFCVMDDHFHLLVAVPQRPERLPTGEEVVRRLRRLTAQQLEDFEGVEQRLGKLREAGDAEGERRFLEGYYRRMWDVSLFMKSLKQRFTQWHNRKNGRRGTLWEQRYKSVVVEASGTGLGAVAAYIDLNPVRAGLVKDPQDYHWSGYGEAMAGKRLSREGLRKVVERMSGVAQPSGSQALELYRGLLHLEGNEGREELLAVLKAKGKLGLGEYMRCRVRYFSDGAVLGSQGFVEGMLKSRGDWFRHDRKSGAHPMQGLERGQLYSARNLQLRLFK